MPSAHLVEAHADERSGLGATLGPRGPRPPHSDTRDLVLLPLTRAYQLTTVTANGFSLMVPAVS